MSKSKIEQMEEEVDREALERKALFSICQSKEHLKLWIKRYLGIDLPDTIVCGDDITNEPSNSSPLDLIWEVYQKALDGTDENFQRVLAYAARDSFKTLSASILEILCLFHLRRNVAHMAAIESQAQKCASYIGKYIQRPYLKDFVEGKNKREITVCRYEDDEGNILSPDEFDELDYRQQRKFQPISHYLKIIIATLAGANCIDPAAKISMANNLYKEAWEIVPNDIVKSFNTKTRKFEFVPVKDIGFVRKNTMRVTCKTGDTVVVSEDHPILTRNGWLPARSLKVGTKLVSSGESYIPSSSFELDLNIHEKNVPHNPWSVVYGTLLGDSSLTWDYRWSAPRLQLFHCDKQYDLLKSVAGALEELEIKYSICRDGSGFKLTSSIDDRFKEIWELLYGKGRKAVSKEYLDRIDLEALAYWLMDDVRGSSEQVGIRKDHKFELATCSFTEKENQLIIDWLNEKFNVKARLGSVTNQSKKIYPIVSISLSSSRHLSAILDGYILPCVKYKFPTPTELLVTRCIKCDRKLDFVNRKGFSYCKEHLKHPYSWRKELKEWDNISSLEVSKLEYIGYRNCIDIHLNTELPELMNFVVNGSILAHNSEHCSFMVLDELDLAPEAPLEEAKMIPAPGEVRGELPITFMTSSRKFAFGNVQKEIDKTNKDKDYGLQVRHWNLLDVTRQCPPERHLPSEPKTTIYYSERSLKAIDADSYGLLSPEEQLKYYKAEGFAGCLKNCSLFSVCRGRLATKQPGTSKMLKPIPHVANQFKSVSVEHAKAQLLCWKPSAEGLVYPNFQYSRHMLDPIAMYEAISGEEIPRKTEDGQIHPEFIEFSRKFNKLRLIEYMMSRGMEFYSGMDWGYTHNWAVVTGARDGHRFFVFDVISIPGLEIMQKVETAKSKLSMLPKLVIYPDSEDPSSIKTFRRHGFTMKNFAKDVLAGINAVRSKLLPGLGKEPELFFLSGDEGCELLAMRMAQYHWKLDANQKPTDTPDDIDDDECFTEETEVLTDHGWKFIKDLFGFEKVMAVDGGGYGKFELPENVIKKQYNGKIFKVDDHPHIEFGATENHKHAVISQYNYKKLKKNVLEKRTIKKLPSESYWLNNLTEWPEGKGLFSQGEDEAWMAGFWLADGCFDECRPTFLLFDQTKIVHQNEFRDRATRLGWVWSETKNGNSIRFCVSGQKERKIFWQHMMGSDCYNKYLTLPDIRVMSYKERKAFWDGYMAGDGSMTTSGWHFDSVSKQVIDGIQLLTLSLGMGCRIVSYDCMKAGRKVKNPQGKTYLSHQSWRGHVLRKTPVSNLKKDRIKSYDFNGMVYCVKTSTGQFLARNNGKVFVAGNCDALRYVIQNLYGTKGRVWVEVPGVSPFAQYDPSFPIPGQYDNSYRYNALLQPEKMPIETPAGETVDNWLQKEIDRRTGYGSELDSLSKSGRKGTFVFDLN